MRSKPDFAAAKLKLEHEAEWPDDTELLVAPIAKESSLGIRDEGWPTDAEGIARLLALIESLEPFEMSPEEEAEWNAAMEAQKECDKSNFEANAQRLKRMFE
jgi:hypothetical protein